MCVRSKLAVCKQQHDKQQSENIFLIQLSANLLLKSDNKSPDIDLFGKFRQRENFIIYAFYCIIISWKP